CTSLPVPRISRRWRAAELEAKFSASLFALASALALGVAAVALPADRASADDCAPVDQLLLSGVGAGLLNGESILSGSDALDCENNVIDGTGSAAGNAVTGSGAASAVILNNTVFGDVSVAGNGTILGPTLFSGGNATAVIQNNAIYGDGSGSG